MSSKSIRSAHTGADWEYLYHARVFGEGRICPTRCWADPAGGDPVCSEEIYQRSANYNSTQQFAPGCDAGDHVMSIEADAMRNWENLVGQPPAARPDTSEYGYGSVVATTNPNIQAVPPQVPQAPAPMATAAPPQAAIQAQIAAQLKAAAATAPALPALPAAPAEYYREPFYIGDRPMNRMSPAGEACGIADPISEDISNPFRKDISYCRSGLTATAGADVQVPFRDHQSCYNLAQQSAFPGKRLDELSYDERNDYLPAFTQSLCSSRRHNGCRCDSAAVYPDPEKGIRMQ